MNRLLHSFVILLFTSGVLSAFDADAALPGQAPAYNPKTEIEVAGTVSGTHEVPAGVLAGVYLTVKVKTGTVEMYLAPANFVKIFDVQFKEGAEVKAIGSKVEFEGKDLVLAREVEIGKIKLSLRDANGIPQWLWMSKPDLPTGF